MGVILVEETKGHPEAERNEPLKFLRSHDNGKQAQVDFFFASRRMREMRKILILAACGWVKRILS